MPSNLQQIGVSREGKGNELSFFIWLYMLILRPCGLRSFDLRRVAINTNGHISCVSIVIGTYCKTISLRYGQILEETMFVYF